MARSQSRPPRHIPTPRSPLAHTLRNKYKIAATSTRAIGASLPGERGPAEAGARQGHLTSHRTCGLDDESRHVEARGGDVVACDRCRGELAQLGVLAVEMLVQLLQEIIRDKVVCVVAKSWELHASNGGFRPSNDHTRASRWAARARGAPPKP